jgi:AhpD family alkylhydroperoxidase
MARSVRVAEFQTISQGGLESKFAANANQTLTHVKNQLNTPLGGERSRRSLYIRGYILCVAAIAFRESHGSGEDSMMLDWNEYQKEVGARLGELSKLSPDTLKGYLTLSGANGKTTLLGEKTRQLISLAVAVTTRCDGCIVFHTDAALKAGASKEEISEALGVAVAMNAGAALIYSTRVLDAVEAKATVAKSS